MAAKQSVRLIGCAVAAATGLTVAGMIVQTGLLFIKLPNGGGINVAVGVEAERIGAAVVDGPLRTVIGARSFVW